MVGRMRYALPLSSSLARKFDALSEELDVRVWDPDAPVQVGPLTLEPYRVFHPVEAYGVRVTGPSSLRPGERAVLAYTGDTDACDGVVELARDADLLLSEAAFHEGRDDGVERGIHLTGRRAGEVATAGRWSPSSGKPASRRLRSRPSTVRWRSAPMRRKPRAFPPPSGPSPGSCGRSRIRSRASGP